MTITIKLPPKLDIDAASALHADMLHMLQPNQDVALDCKDVDALGTAAAQLFFSLSKTLHFSGHSLKLQSISVALQGDFAALGMTDILLGDQHV